MKSDSRIIVGWDIGGVNIKAVRFEWRCGKIKAMRTVVCPFEIWREHASLKMKLREIGEKLDLQDSQKMAVTMTAELSDVFRSKREGVLYVLNAIEQAFEKSYLYPFSINGEFLSMYNARKNPLVCAATNWVASARFISSYHADCIPPDFVLMDIGSTTTDIIPIRGGKVVVQGNTDTRRLMSGELLYTGILRTNPNTVVRQLPVEGRLCRVAAEHFTSMADVYLILGLIAPDEYSCPTADGRAKTISAARERLSRLVCSDSEIMCSEEIHKLACYIREKQLQQIVEALFQVLSGLQGGFSLPLAVVGTGGFLAMEAAGRLGISVIELEEVWDHQTLAGFPALAAGYLLAQELTGEELGEEPEK